MLSRAPWVALVLSTLKGADSFTGGGCALRGPRLDHRKLPLTAVHGRRCATPVVRMSADVVASWADLDAASGSKEKTVATLNALKASGEAELWDSLNPNLVRNVNLRELQGLTQVQDIEKAFALGGSETEFEELKNIFFTASLAATGIAVLCNIFVPGIVGFTLTYVFALVPVFLLGIGSVAPGLLAEPLKLFNSKSKEDMDLRVARHEAAHLFMAYIAGYPVESVSIADGETTAAVKLFDENIGQLDISAEQVPKLALVSMSGLMGELIAYGETRGGAEDLKQLQFIMSRAMPRIQPRDQQGQTRWGAYQSWSFLKQYETKYNALVTAVGEGKSVAQCIQILEETA